MCHTRYLVFDSFVITELFLSRMKNQHTDTTVVCVLYVEGILQCSGKNGVMKDVRGMSR